LDFLYFLIQFVTKALGCDVTGKSEEFQSIPGCGLKALLSLLTVRYLYGRIVGSAFATLFLHFAWQRLIYFPHEVRLS
jgi:hypothetical protein